MRGVLVRETRDRQKDWGFLVITSHRVWSKDEQHIYITLIRGYSSKQKIPSKDLMPESVLV